MKRFHNKALDCCELMEEGVLVNVCLWGNVKRMYLLGEYVFLLLSQSMEVAHHTN